MARTAAKLKIKCKDLKTVKDGVGCVRGATLLVCISSHRVPSLILIHMHTPDVGLLVHLNGTSCRNEDTLKFHANKGINIYACVSVCASTVATDGRDFKLCSSSCTSN